MRSGGDSQSPSAQIAPRWVLTPPVTASIRASASRPIRASSSRSSRARRAAGARRPRRGRRTRGAAPPPSGAAGRGPCRRARPAAPVDQAGLGRERPPRRRARRRRVGELRRGPQRSASGDGHRWRSPAPEPGRRVVQATRPGRRGPRSLGGEQRALGVGRADLRGPRGWRRGRARRSSASRRGRATGRVRLNPAAASACAPLLQVARLVEVGHALLGDDVGDVVAVDHDRCERQPGVPADLDGVERLDEACGTPPFAVGLHDLHDELASAARRRPRRPGRATRARRGAGPRGPSPMFGAPPKPESRPWVTVEELPSRSICRVAADEHVDRVQARRSGRAMRLERRVPSRPGGEDRPGAPRSSRSMPTSPPNGDD